MEITIRFQYRIQPFLQIIVFEISETYITLVLYTYVSGDMYLSPTVQMAGEVKL